MPPRNKNTTRVNLACIKRFHRYYIGQPALLLLFRHCKGTVAVALTLGLTLATNPDRPEVSRKDTSGRKLLRVE